eukprot:COSAG06_NODE_2104_length_7581_cov_9.832130_4_plen_264_part_00
MRAPPRAASAARGWLTSICCRVRAEEWANAAIEMAQRLAHPPFDAALQKFLRGEDELSWKSGEAGAVAPDAVVFDAAGEWVFLASVPFGEVSFDVPHRLRLSSDGVNAAILCEGHPQAAGLLVRGKGTWESVQGGAAISVSLTLDVHKPSTRKKLRKARLVRQGVFSGKLNAAAVLMLNMEHGGGGLITPDAVFEFEFEFSLCLSRACLGKIMHLMYKWHRKKWRFDATWQWQDSDVVSLSRVCSRGRRATSSNGNRTSSAAV